MNIYIYIFYIEADNYEIIIQYVNVTSKYLNCLFVESSIIADHAV